jgi:hypothetical protein
MLEDLPELSDYDNPLMSNYSSEGFQQNDRPDDASEKYKKHIRETMKIPREAGMSDMPSYQNNQPQHYIPNNVPFSSSPQVESYVVNYPPPQYVSQQQFSPMYQQNQHYSSLNNYGGIKEGFRENMETSAASPITSPSPLPQSTCQATLDHVETCRICCKIYKSQMNLYLIIIAALVVLCLLLIKKVLSL